MNEFQDFIEIEIRRKLKEKNIVIWFDEQKVFSAIFDAVKVPAEKLKFDGSFLKLRFKIYEQDPDFDKKWLIYIPMKEEEADWIRELTVQSDIYADTFEIIFKKLGYELSTENKDLINKNAKEIAEHPERFSLRKQEKKDDEIVKENLFAGVFNESVFEIKSILLKFVNETGYDKNLEKNKNEFIQLVCLKTGDKNIRTSTLQELRENIIRTALFSEFYHKKKEKESFNFKQLLPEEYSVRMLSEFIDVWQKNSDYKYNFIAHSDRIGSQYQSLLLDIIDYHDILEVSAFRRIDEHIFERITKSFERGTVDIKKIIREAIDLYETIKIRKNLFWAKQDKKNNWVLLEKCLVVILNSNDAIENLSPTATKEDMIKLYIAEFWKIDMAYREFAALIIENQHKIEDIQYLLFQEFTGGNDGT